MGTIHKFTNIYEIFNEATDTNIQMVRTNAHKLKDEYDTKFALQLCDFYDAKGYLTALQMTYMIQYFIEINSL